MKVMGRAKSRANSGGIALPRIAPTNVSTYHIGQTGVMTPKKYDTFRATDQSGFFSNVVIEIA